MPFEIPNVNNYRLLLKKYKDFVDDLLEIDNKKPIKTRNDWDMLSKVQKEKLLGFLKTI